MHFHKDNTIPVKGWIWVFGSNLGGRHGKGAAHVARVNFGAEYGKSMGRTGDSYAIPTKSRNLETLGLPQIALNVDAFILYQYLHPELKFFVTRVGCGLAGYPDHDIAPLFYKVGDNCSMPEQWKEFLVRMRA